MIKGVMPEGPEVRVITDQLQKFIGSKIERTKVYVKKYAFHSEGDTITDIVAIGKKLIFTFNDDHACVLRLGMTGKILMKADKYTTLEIHTSKGSIYFDDARKFGRCDYLEPGYLLEYLQAFGMVVLNTAREIKKYDLIKLNCDILLEMVRKYPRRQITAFLMDDSIIDGVGNYLKSEIIHDIGVSPFIKIGELSDAQVMKLCKSIDKIMKAAYKNGGLTLRDFRDTEGYDGRYVSKVYGQDETSSGRKVKTVKTADGRTTHYVVE